jgi:hypothetical protein
MKPIYRIVIINLQNNIKYRVDIAFRFLGIIPIYWLQKKYYTEFDKDVWEDVILIFDTKFEALRYISGELQKFKKDDKHK